jgi:hypothetical protein
MTYRKIISKFCFLSIVIFLFADYHAFSQTLIKNSGFKKDSLSLIDSEGEDDGLEIYLKKDIGIRSVWVDEIKLKAVKSADIPAAPGGLGTYYISPLGDDNNSGSSPEEAWQTVDKVNSMDFGPGDEILFKGGETFTGNLFFDKLDSGTASNNIVINSYGTGRAVINGQTGNGLLAKGSDYLTIKNLNFIGDGRDDGNSGDGIILDSCSYIYLDSIEVSGFQHSGLIVANEGTNFHITNIYSHNNGFCGICVIGTNKTSILNVYIGYCIADNNPGDPTILDNHSGNGILAYNASNITIEYCKASNNGWDMPRIGNGPGGIWVAEVDSAVIQYCISHDNKTSAGSKDGLGFDLDGGTTNSIIQYCLSYNNQGAGYGIFQYNGATNWSNNTVRYCISENDGNVSDQGSVIFWNGSNNANNFKNFEFYNNIVYNSNGPALAFIDHNNSNFNFRNNIFVSKRNSVFGGIAQENFQGNCWYSNNGQFQIENTVFDFEDWAADNNQEMWNGDIVGMYANPMLLNPGNSTLTDPTILETINDYKVAEGSPVIDAGLDLEMLFTINPGNQDYFGNLIKQGQAFDMGIHQFFDKQLIRFTNGWNIKSSNLLPTNSDIESIFQLLISNSSLVKIQDEEGSSLEKINGNWNNNIGDIALTEGYKVKVNVNDSIEIYGAPVDLPYAIPLTTGWNIIGYPQTKSFDGLDVVQELIARGTLIKVQDEAGNSIEKLSGNWINHIGSLTAGEGYKIKVNSSDTLWISDNYPKSATLQIKRVTATHFIPEYKGNGTDHMNIYLLNTYESGMEYGDEIGIFDGNICVGSAKINLHHSKFKIQHSAVSIPVSAADGNDSKNGYIAGNTITVKLYRNGTEYPLTIEPQNNEKPVFAKGGTLLAKVGLATSMDNLTTYEGAEIKCYPNPFNNEMTIEINLEAESEIELEILNQLSQRVKFVKPKQMLTQGIHKLLWNGKNSENQAISPGIYHLRIRINSVVYYRKIILTN